MPIANRVKNWIRNSLETAELSAISNDKPGSPKDAISHHRGPQNNDSNRHVPPVLKLSRHEARDNIGQQDRDVRVRII